MKIETLDSLCEINPESLNLSTPANFEFLYVDISAVTKGRIDWSATRELSLADAPSRARRRLRPGDVLLCTVRPSLQAHARIKENGTLPLIASTGFAVLRPKIVVDSAFIFHQLFTDSVSQQLRRLVTGSNYPAVNERDIRHLRVCVPDVSERTSIAAVLDAVDETIAKTEAVIAKLKQVRAGLLHDLLTRGLDLSACNAQAGENGQLRDPIAHPEQFQDSPLGRIPVKWNVQTLESVTEPSAPICYGIVQAMEFIPNGVPVLTIRDLLGDFISGIHRTAREIDAAYARSRVRPDDVLISVKGTIGRVDIVPRHFHGNISRDLARIRPNARVRSTFLAYLLRSAAGQRILERAQVGTTRAELSIAPLKQLSFAFPPPPEQEQLAKILETQDKAIRSYQHELQKLVHLKSGLMSDLLTGRVRVPESLLEGV